ncbi:MAG TPA: ribonuclease P protein component [Rhodanobacteraceae bacterium]
MTAGLPPAARLRSIADFHGLRRPSGRASVRCFALRWSESTTGHSRLGMAVSRKVSTRAVVRNRIKRVVRESFRQRRVRLPALDLLVIAQTAAATTENADLRDDLERAWRRVQALKPPAAPGTIAD